MEFSERQLELARSLAIKERRKEIEAYRKLGLSYLCSYCRNFLDTDDYSEFVRRRKRWVHDLKGGVEKRGSKVAFRYSLGHSSIESEFLLQFLMIPMVALFLYVFFLTMNGVIAVLAVLAAFAGALFLAEKIDALTDPVKTKIRWLKNAERPRILVIDEGHVHKEFRYARARTASQVSSRTS